MTQKFILPGSVECDDETLTAGILEGTHEFDINNTLRYVQGKIKDMQKGETLISFMSRIYDNSTGCLIKRTFKRNNK